MTDREAITDAIYRYCRAMDRIDPELGRSVWHPDGTADYGPGRFSGNGREIVDRVCLIHAKLLTIRIRSPTSSSNSTPGRERGLLHRHAEDDARRTAHPDYGVEPLYR